MQATTLPCLHVSQYAAEAGWLLSWFLSYVPWIKFEVLVQNLVLGVTLQSLNIFMGIIKSSEC